MVATAGHVDHGKSSLILRLTGIDPDRWAEEKRRGLTIDLGYAWCTLPSGREIGFVDVPGHERFIGNMLAGVGPVRLVLFVVAADEGWKPQSEEHLQILDVLGVAGGVIALTKRDLVDDEMLAIAADEVRERVAGTGLFGAPIVPVSSETGEGVDELASAMDAMLDGAGPAEDARTRLHVDRVFTIKGAGTVVTGTLAGGCIDVGDAVEVYPTGIRARIRSLQTHKQAEDRACPVSRVAANLVGVERERLGRGDVLATPETWRPTRVFEARTATRARSEPRDHGARRFQALRRRRGGRRASASVRDHQARGGPGSVRADHDVGAGRVGRGRPVRRPRERTRGNRRRRSRARHRPSGQGGRRPRRTFGGPRDGDTGRAPRPAGRRTRCDPRGGCVPPHRLTCLRRDHRRRVARDRSPPCVGRGIRGGDAHRVPRRASTGRRRRSDRCAARGDLGPSNRAWPDRRDARRRTPQRPERTRGHRPGRGHDPLGVAPGGAR